MKNLKLLSKLVLSFESSGDFEQQIKEILEEVGNYMDANHIYIVFNETEGIIDNIFEWCNGKMKSYIESFEKISYEDMLYLWKAFENDGYIYIKDIMNLQQDIVDMLKPLQIESLLIYPLIIEKEVKGFIVVDGTKDKGKWKAEELEIFNIIARLIASEYEKRFFLQDIIVSETNFRNFFETIDDMFIVSDLSGKIIHCNRSLINKLGYSLLELKTKNIIELHPVDKRKEASVIVDKMLAQEISYCPLEIENKQGDIYSVETRTWFGKWDKQDCIYSVSKDVTKEENLTRDLKEQCNKLTNVIEGTGLGTWEWNVQTGEFESNGRWVEMIGYSKEDLQSRDNQVWNNFSHPEDMKRSNRMIEKHLNGEIEYYDCEVRMKHKDGRWIWFQIRGRVIERDYTGSPVKMFGTHLDITFKKEAVEALKESEKRFLLALDETKAGLWDMDMISGEVFLSPMWKNILGYEDDEIENSFKSWEKLWHPDDKDKIEKSLEDYLKGENEHYEVIHRLRHKNGSWRWILTSGGILKDHKGIAYRWIGTNIDITKEHEQALELEKFFSVNLDLLCIVDMEGNFIKTNKAWQDILGYSSDQLRGHKIFDFVHEDDIPSTLEAMEQLKKNKKVDRFTNRYINLDGQYRYIEWRTNPHEDMIYAAARDITDRIEYENKILEISNRDTLTNIYNRRYVYDRAEEIIEESKRTGKTFSVCILDIDHFKKINDNYGHQIGDCVLKEFTKIIGENLRPYDILGRYGGEEFIVILNNADAKESNLIIERILNIIRNKTFNFNGQDIKFTFSAGISNCNEIEKEKRLIDNLVGTADQRMYQAKRAGRNKIIYKTP